MTSPLFDELARLVAFPTVSSRPLLDLAAHVAERLEGLGFRVERLASEPGKCNLVAARGPAGTDGLVLSGHMDVVPVDGQPWTSDPFVLTDRDGRWVGRGTADMKGFLAAVLQALEGLRDVPFRRELVLIWTHDEELGCLGSARLAATWDRDARPLPCACLIGEPTGFRAMRMHAGHCAVHVDVTGAAAHTSRPELGDNAIERAADVIASLRALADELRRERHDELPMDAPWVPLAVTCVHGGTAVNVVPDACRIDLGYRPLPGTAPDAVFRRIVDRLQPFGDRVHARLGTVAPPMLTPDGTALARLLAPDAAPGPEVAPFATDGGHLARLGLQPIVFGPGSIDVAHKADEHVDGEAIARTVGIVQRLIRARCID